MKLTFGSRAASGNARRHFAVAPIDPLRLVYHSSRRSRNAVLPKTEIQESQLMLSTYASLFAFCVAVSHAVDSFGLINYATEGNGVVDGYQYITTKDTLGTRIVWANYDSYSPKGNDINKATEDLLNWALSYYDELSLAERNGNCKIDSPQQVHGSAACSKDKAPGWTGNGIAYYKLVLLLAHSDQFRTKNMPYAVCTMHQNQRACVSWALESSGALGDLAFNSVLNNCYNACTSKQMSCQHQLGEHDQNGSVCFSDNPRGCGLWGECSTFD